MHFIMPVKPAKTANRTTASEILLRLSFGSKLFRETLEHIDQQLVKNAFSGADDVMNLKMHKPHRPDTGGTVMKDFERDLLK